VSARSRAKTAGTLADLTAAQLEDLWEAQNGRCALTGIPMTFDAGGSETNASIDRINAGGPYTLDNIQLVCYRANWMKNTMDMDSFNYWVSVLFKHRSEK
jgi:hypothetical protein